MTPTEAVAKELKQHAHLTDGQVELATPIIIAALTAAVEETWEEAALAMENYAAAVYISARSVACDFKARAALDRAGPGWRER